MIRHQTLYRLHQPTYSVVRWIGRKCVPSVGCPGLESRDLLIGQGCSSLETVLVRMDQLSECVHGVKMCKEDDVEELCELEKIKQC